MRTGKILLAAGLTSALIGHQDVLADGEAPVPAKPTTLSQGTGGLESATGEQLANASAHYARARSLLIAAVNEFDKGYKVANPDAILDSKLWRETLIDRAEELQKVLDPQPRLSRGGVKFEGDTRLLNGSGK